MVAPQAIQAHSAAKSAEIQAVLTLGDGTVVDLGTLSYWHRSPLRRLWWTLMHWRHRQRLGALVRALSARQDAAGE